MNDLHDLDVLEKRCPPLRRRGRKQDLNLAVDRCARPVAKDPSNLSRFPLQRHPVLLLASGVLDPLQRVIDLLVLPRQLHQSSLVVLHAYPVPECLRLLARSTSARRRIFFQSQRLSCSWALGTNGGHDCSQLNLARCGMASHAPGNQLKG